MKNKSNIAEIRNRVQIPLKVGSAEFYTFNNLSDDKEHVVIAQGNWRYQKIINVRVHSECMTGEIFGSSKCECGDQLNESLRRFKNEGGLIVYLRQEGRGIGLYNKLDAYALQDQGLDTVEANLALNFDPDLREYKVAAEMLNAMDVKKIKLYSNNPLKENSLLENGIDVISRKCTGLYIKQNNYSYLKTKAERFGHKINLNKIDQYLQRELV